RSARITARGRKPRNDQRPTCWPCSADSSRNDGPSPRSLRYADTGVSQSAMNVCRSGTSEWSRASSRTSSSEGVRSRSTATAIQDLVGVAQLQPPPGQQDGEVVQHVRGLLRHALVRLLARRARDLLGLLAHLRGHELAVLEQPARVGVGAAPLGDGALERRERLGRDRLEVPVVEAGPLAGVAGGPGGLHEHEDRVLVAVEPELLHALDVARGLALVPELLARARPEPRLAGLARAPERLVVHVRERQHLAGAGVLDYAGQKVHGVIMDASSRLSSGTPMWPRS